MKLAELTTAVEKLRHASRFRYGDPLTFSIPFMRLQVELPGPHDPGAYFDFLKRKLNVELPLGGKIMVVSPGNGGLCAEVLARGAEEVLAVEGRVRFHDCLEDVLRVLDRLYPEPIARTFRRWPQPGDVEHLGEWDVIILAEGLEECRTPNALLEALFEMLAPEGVMIAEVTHGTQNSLPDPVNSYLPTREAWLTAVSQVSAQDPASEGEGRSARRRIYTFTRTGAPVGKVQPAPRESLPAFPRDPEAKVTQIASVPPPPPPPAETPPTAETPAPPPGSPSASSVMRVEELREAVKKDEVAEEKRKNGDTTKAVAQGTPPKDWADTFQPPLDKIKDTTRDVKRPEKVKKKAKKQAKKKAAKSGRSKKADSGQS